MNTSSFKNLFFLFTAALTMASVAADAGNSQGIVIKFDHAKIELAAVSTNILRLSVALEGKPNPAPSTFLADTQADHSVTWKKIKQEGMIGIQTQAGELLMNPKNGQWMLEAADGKVLIPPHVIGDFKTSSGKSSLDVSLGMENGDSTYVYGCGNGVNSLEQHEGDSRLGNGLAVIPYYWSKAGYAVLAVTENDNRPAKWHPATDGQSVTWTFPGKKADLYLMPAATLKDAAREYAQLTGYAPVPPLWAFGYLQSRWGWANRAYIEDTLRKFHDLDIPVDGFIYDFEWYAHNPDYAVPAAGLKGFEDFGWNSNLFPDPAAQIKQYKDQGVHFIGIRKPRLGNPASLAMMRQKHWELDAGPGQEGFQSRNINFANPDVRAWYETQSADLLKDGVDGWWNDEGEASYTTYYYWNMAEEEAMNKYEPGKRLWTLNRAFSPGLQRFGAAAWTGDIKAAWDVFAATPTTLLNWNLAGLPYETCDIGGFFETPSPELLSRWMEAGVFFPVMRTHSVFDVKPHFPWLFGNDALNAIRGAIDFRYRLIPFYYSLAHETSETGLPIMRPLVMEFPDDPKVANLSDEWLMGSSLLAAPVLTPGEERPVYLPEGRWYAFESNVPLQGNRTMTVRAGLNEIPAYVREGTILPLGPVVQHTSELPGGPLEVEVYPGKDATFTLFEDDGETTNYLNGEVRRTTFQWNDATRMLSWTTEGNYDGRNIFKKLHVTVFYPPEKLQAEGDLNQNGSLTVTQRR